MRWNLARNLAVVPLVLGLVLAGCYEHHDTVDATAPDAAPAPQTQTGAGGVGATYGNTPNPSHSGAMQAAHNTEDRIAERQRELEKAMEDQD